MKSTIWDKARRCLARDRVKIKYFWDMCTIEVQLISQNFLPLYRGVLINVLSPVNLIHDVGNRAVAFSLMFLLPGDA